MDTSKIIVTDIDYDTKDYPDFCDSCINSAEINGRELTESELDELNEDRDFVYESVMDNLY